MDSGGNPSIENIRCSCSYCNSGDCFNKRRQKILCSCNECDKSRTWLFLNNNNLSPSYSSKVVDDKHETTKELIKKEINYDNDRDSDVTNERSLSVQKVIDVGDDDLESESDNDLQHENVLTIANSRKVLSPSTAKLSAQIMNVPYKDFEQSISRHKPEKLPILTSISPFDIYKKIKEVYKACSCKVCECIIGKSQKRELCKCKPCNCEVCTSFMTKLNIKGKIEELPRLYPDVSCPCTRCNRKSCAGLVKKPSRIQACDCVPCECVRCSDSFSKPCSCTPCHCIKCRSLSNRKTKTIVVAPMEEDYQQRTPCQCSPCNCIECGHGASVPSNGRREISTGINRHPRCNCDTCVDEACLPDNNDTCKCERRDRIVRKPVQRDSNDYDIRRSKVTCNYRHFNYNNEHTRNTVSMYTAITRTPYFNTQMSKCDCKKCSCIDCNYFNEFNSTRYAANALKSSQIFKTQKLNEQQSENHCECMPCECQICGNLKNTKPTRLNNIACSCNICDCLHCVKMFHPPNDNKLERKYLYNLCTCSTCECNVCDKIKPLPQDKKSINAGAISEIIYPVKKGENLTPSVFRDKFSNHFMELSSNVYNKLNKLTTTQPADLFKENNYSVHDEPQQSTSNNKHNNNEFYRYFSPRSDTYTVRNSSRATTNATNTISKNNGFDYPVIRSDASTSSSMSFSKESGSLSVLSGLKHKSYESSCNSSGHDNSNYLVQFPKTVLISRTGNLETLCNIENLKITPQNENISNKDFLQSLNKSHIKNNHIDNDLSKINYDECSSVGKNSIGRKCSSKSNVANRYQNIMKMSKEINQEEYQDVKSNFSYSSANLLENDKIGQDDNYEVMQNILREARLFSKDQLKLLEKYEKANKEFESVSKKLEFSKNLLIMSLCNNCEVLNVADASETEDKVYDFDDVPTKEDKNTNENNDSPDFAPTNVRFSVSANIMIAEGDRKPKVLQNFELNESGNTLNSKASLNPVSEERELSKSPASERKHMQRRKKMRKYNRMYKRSVKFSPSTKSTADIENINDIGISLTHDAKDNTQSYAMEVRDIIPNSQLAVQGERLTDFNNEIQLKMPLLKTLYSYLPQDDKALIVIKPPLIHKQVHCIDESQLHKILQSNYSQQTVPGCENKDISTEALFDSNFNENMTIAQLPVNLATRINFGCNENQALVKLRSEVKKLLDMSHLKTFEIVYKGDDYDSKKMSHISCKSFKVTHVLVRRFTKDAALVKWKPPRVIDNVDGYELLIDGLAVQRILSPECCMSIVSCLKRDSMLVTVRTIMKSPNLLKHRPATTVIYNFLD